MRGDTLIQRHPPTPPTLVGDFQSGLHRVAQYNADRGYPYDEASYGVHNMVGQEGIPSRMSHVGSHDGEGISLGMQYVGTPELLEVTMLTRSKDTYGAPEHYHASQHDGRSVCSEFRYAATKLTSGRRVKASSHHQPQGQQRMTIMPHDPLAVYGQKQPQARHEDMTALSQSQHQKPERQRRPRARRPRHRS